MFTTLLTLFTTCTNSSIFKYVAYAIPIAILAIWLGITKYQYSSLESYCKEQEQQIFALNISVSNAQGTIANLNAATDAKVQEIEDTQDLLRLCYERANQQTADLAQVDQNMKQPTYTEINKDTKGEIEYVPVSKEQNKAGIDFVNAQLASLY